MGNIVRKAEEKEALCDFVWCLIGGDEVFHTIGFLWCPGLCLVLFLTYIMSG